MDTKANRSQMLDHRTVAVFAGIDVIPRSDTPHDDFSLEVSIMAVGRNGWREIVEHKRFERPFTTECNDAVWSYLELVRFTQGDSDREFRITKTVCDTGYMRDEAVAFCSHPRSRINGVVPVRGAAVANGGPLVQEARSSKLGIVNVAQTDRAKEDLRARMPIPATTEDISDSDALAYVAEWLSRKGSRELSKALGFDEVTRDISKIGDVTIILTNPDGEKRVVSVEDYNADIIADYLKSGTVQERLAKAQLALAESKLLMQVPERVRRLLSAQHHRIDKITEAEAAKLVDDRSKRRSEAIESALQHLHRTDAEIRSRVSEMLWAQNIAA